MVRTMQCREAKTVEACRYKGQLTQKSLRKMLVSCSR